MKILPYKLLAPQTISWIYFIRITQDHPIKDHECESTETVKNYMTETDLMITTKFIRV